MSSESKRSLLVFGASGFTGRHLAGLLSSAGWVVHDGRQCGADLTDRPSIEASIDRVSPDSVINLAALSSPAETDVPRLYAVNAFGWLNILEALGRRRYKGRVILASSANVYGPHTSGAIHEDAVLDPANHYAIAKRLAEQFTSTFGGDLDVVTMRPFNCIGAGQNPAFLVPKLIAHFRERRPTIDLGNVEIARDFVDIRDAANAYRVVLEADDPPRLVNIASGRAVSLCEILSILRGLTGHNIQVRVDPALVRPNELRYQRGDVSRLCALGWRPAYSIRDSLDWMLRTKPEQMNSGLQISL